MAFYDIEKLNKMENVFAMIISGRKYGKKKFKERIKMIKFKVGDKVRVRDDLIPGEVYGNVGFVSSMKNMRGKIATIKDFYFDYCNMYLKENGYLWSPEMLEPVKDDRLIFNGNETILFKGGKKYVTKCDESDTYDREKGLLTVLAKANGYNYNDIQEMLKNATIKGKDMQVREN